MTQYYFLATALPALHFGAPPDITFQEFDTIVRENLTESDRHWFLVLRRYYDIQNMRAFWKGESFDPYGTWNEKELEEALLDRIGVPAYIDSFLDAYSDTKDRLEHFPELIGAYFRVEAEEAKGFVKEYLDFERELRLVLVAIRAKALNRDLLKELQFEDPSETLVAHILAQKDAPEYEPPERFQALKQIFQDHASDPLDLHQALCQFRYDAVQQMVGVQMFSLDRILGYTVRLIMVLMWLDLDAKRGIKMVDEMIKERA